VNRLKDVALAFVFVSFCVPVFGDNPRSIVLGSDESLRVESLSPTIDILEDPSGKLDIGAVSSGPAAAGFVAGTPENTNIGFSRSAWWVRFGIANGSTDHRRIYLRQGYPLIDALEVYAPAQDGWKRFVTGDRTAFRTRPVNTRDFLFPLDAAPGSQSVIYARFQSQGPVDINLSLLGADELAETLGEEQLAYGVYFGAVLMLLVWSGLVFIAVRDGAFLAYFAYVGTFGLYMSVNTGFAFEYLWPNSPAWGNAALLALLNLALVTALQFSTTILAAREYTPILHKLARVQQALALIFCALIPVLDYAVLVRPTAFLIMIGVVFLISLGFVNMLSGSRPARFFVIAWSAFLVGSLVFLLKNFGVVPHTFLTQHSWQVGSLLEMILLSMTLSSRMNELKHQGRTDALTMLGNRRLFDDKLPVEFGAARASGKPISLLMLDIDNFKNYNDRNGHAWGDEAIKQVGAALRKFARKPVLACRFGGDEFCVILPGADTASAALVAERLRATVEATRDDEFRVTISVGYASIADGDFKTHENLFDAADAALYSAKEAGRNQVAAFTGKRAADRPLRSL
jgi:diguanylate cyclase (GGDEF)-like protein